MSKDKNFWNTKNGKILSHTIHDHNSGLAIAGSWKSFIISLTKKNAIIFDTEETKDDFNKAINGINTGLDKCKEAVDYCYTKFKEQEDE